MQSAVALNVQQSIRPGEDCDTYYAGKENSHLQAHATVEDNRFFVALPSLNSGSSSTVTFNPNEGLAEVIMTLRLPAPSSAAGLALQEGWGYDMLRRIGYRYGSSQLYYITGAQNLVEALSLCEDSGKKQQLFFLGGQALLTAADWADAGKRTAYVYLRLPHSSPALSGAALPFPTDVLTAPVQLQIDLNDFTRVVSKDPAQAGVIPTTLELATVNFTQVTMQDAGDLVARRFDMSKHALTIPLAEGWCQEEVQFPINVGANGQFQVSLTGCKAGDLKKLRVWVTKDSDQTPDANGKISLNKFIPPSQLTFAINGLIYLDSANGSWLLTNLLRRRQPPVVTYSDIVAPAAPATAWTAAPYANVWCEIDLAQPSTLGNSHEVELVHGVPVMNSVMNLQGIMPIGNTQYTVHCEYVLNCSWMASRGSAEFVF
jgi:hypothetical protein